MTKLMDLVRTPAEVRQDIANIHAQAKPVRDLREKINREVEIKRGDARELSAQIRSIESPIRELHAELMLAEKKAGNQVIALT